MPTTSSAATAPPPAQLDDDQLFYLRARGIDLETARNLLISAFLADAIKEDPDRDGTGFLQGIVSGWPKSQRA